MEKEFCRVRSAKDIVISFVLLAGGCILVLLPELESLKISGFFLVLAGLLLFFILKTSYKDMETGEVYAKQERFFSQEKREHLKHALASPGAFTPEGEDKGNALRLDIYHNKSKVYVQMFEYIPYKYEPCSKVYEHSLHDGDKFLVK